MEQSVDQQENIISGVLHEMIEIKKKKKNKFQNFRISWIKLLLL